MAIYESKKVNYISKPEHINDYLIGEEIYNISKEQYIIIYDFILNKLGEINVYYKNIPNIAISNSNNQMNHISMFGGHNNYAHNYKMTCNYPIHKQIQIKYAKYIQISCKNNLPRYIK